MEGGITNATRTLFRIDCRAYAYQLYTVCLYTFVGYDEHEDDVAGNSHTVYVAVPTTHEV